MHKKKSILIDFIFFFLLLNLSLIFKLAFKSRTSDINIVLLALIFGWGISKSLISRIKFYSVFLIDILFFVLILYCIFNFQFISNTSIHFPKAWSYASFGILYYLLRWFLNDIKPYSKLFNYVLLIILLSGIFQAIVAAFQHQGYLDVTNDYFSLLGSFVSPNSLGAYLSFVLIISTWFLSHKNTVKKVFYNFILFSSLFISCIILISNSRSSWVALMVCLTVYLLNSKTTKIIFKKTSLIKRIVIVISLGVLFVFIAKHLYDLKPESVKGRLFAAKISLFEVSKKPLYGHGLFSFSGVYNKGKADYFYLKERTWSETKVATYLFNPYNDYILVLVEIGCIGLLIFFCLVFFLLKNTSLNKFSKLGLYLTTNGLVLALFYSASSSILLSMMIMFGAAILSSNYKKDSLFKIPCRFWVNLPILLTSLYFMYFILFRLIYKEDAKRYSPKIVSSTELTNAINSTEDNFSSKYLIGEKLYNSGHKSTGIDLMEIAFKNCYAPKIGRKLAYFYLELGNYKRAKEIFILNNHIEPYRYTPKMDLLYFYKKTNNYKKVLKLSEKIIDFPVKVNSPKVLDCKRRASQNLKFYSNFKNKKSKISGSVSKTKLFKNEKSDESLFYRTYLPPVSKITKRIPTIVFLDSHYYLSKSHSLQIVDSLITTNKIDPISLLYINYRSKNAIQKRQNLKNNSIDNLLNENIIKELAKSLPINDNITLFCDFNTFNYLVDKNKSFITSFNYFILDKEGYLFLKTPDMETKNNYLDESKNTKLQDNRKIKNTKTWHVWNDQFKIIISNNLQIFDN